MTLLDRFRGIFGDGMTRNDAKLWAAATTLQDLGNLTAMWLDGSIDSQPGYYGTVDVGEDEAPGLTDTLVLLNLAGYVTNSSQSGFDGHGYDGARWQQLAAVDGFAEPATVAWLQTALAGTRFTLAAHLCKTSRWRRSGTAGRRYSTAWPDGVYVTWRNGVPTTRFGSHLDAATIAEEIYPGCSDQAIDAVCNALQVTVWDPEPGPNDLWPVLADAVERRGGVL